MLPLGEATEDENIEFNWGRKKGLGGPNKDVKFYESFTYDGVEYFLYDCVYMWHENESKPYIGKLVKMWETASHKKTVKVVWFFHPIEIQNWLGDVVPRKNEIFLATGEGIGLFNLNPLEAICGKCNVVCTSKDRRNPQASKEELKMADYIFYRTFDVGSCTISDSFVDVIAGIEVKHFFNREKDQKLITMEPGANLKEKSGSSSSFLKFEGVTAVWNPMKDDKSDFSAKPATKELKIPAAKHSNNLSPTNLSDIRPLKKRKVQFSIDAVDPVIKNLELSKGVNFREKATKISDTSAAQLEQDRGIKTDSQFLEVTRRPGEDTSKWFKQQPWEERMQRAYEKGTLVMLENLDPSYTSSEIEDLVWHAFKAKVDAKMVQRSTFSSPHYGQAVVIFKSKDAAELAVTELNRKCLMLTNGRPVVGRKGFPKKPSDPTKFVGHLSINKFRFQKQREEMKKAVSTSHYSQPNTIEFEMALDWRVLQAKSNLWWDALNKQQAKEVEDLKSQLRMMHRDG